jgi:uncharacterized protein
MSPLAKTRRFWHFLGHYVLGRGSLVNLYKSNLLTFMSLRAKRSNLINEIASSLALLTITIGIGFFNPSTALALEVPPPPDTYVTDRAGILSSETEARLELILAQFEAATSNQVVIATFPSLEGESLEDFSIRLAERWKPGQKEKDNGVILLIFRDERQIRIEVGYGLEGALPDVLAGEIIQNAIVPNFKAGQFDQGALQGTQAILQAIQGEYKGGGAGDRLPNSENKNLIFAVLLIAFVLFLLDTIRYSIYFFGHHAVRDRYGWLEWFIRFSILLALLNVLIRILIYSAASGRGGYSGSRGGFSGGGGSFGGGGASGRW